MCIEANDSSLLIQEYYSTFKGAHSRYSSTCWNLAQANRLKAFFASDAARNSTSATVLDGGRRTRPTCTDEDKTEQNESRSQRVACRVEYKYTMYSYNYDSQPQLSSMLIESLPLLVHYSTVERNYIVVLECLAWFSPGQNVAFMCRLGTIEGM